MYHVFDHISVLIFATNLKNMVLFLFCLDDVFVFNISKSKLFTKCLQLRHPKCYFIHVTAGAVATALYSWH